MEAEDIEKMIDIQIEFLLKANLQPKSICINEDFTALMTKYWQPKDANGNIFKIVAYKGYDLHFTPALTINAAAGVVFPVFVNYTS